MHSDVPIFLAYAHPSGKLDLDFPPQFKARVRELAGEKGSEVELLMAPAGQSKTRRQERAFHALVKPWCDKRGDSVDELKQWLLAEIFGTHTFKVPGTDAVITVLAEPHTSQLTRRQYCDLIEGAMRLAAERDGLYLTAPDEYRKAKEAAEKQAAREAKRRAKQEAACHVCGEIVPSSQLTERQEEWSDGGQSGVEIVQVCKGCEEKPMRRTA